MEPKNQDTSHSAAEGANTDVDFSTVTKLDMEFSLVGKPAPRHRPFESATIKGDGKSRGLVEGTVRILDLDWKWDKKELADYPTTLEDQKRRLQVGLDRILGPLRSAYEDDAEILTAQREVLVEKGENVSRIEKRLAEHKDTFSKIELALKDACNHAEEQLLKHFPTRKITAEYALSQVKEVFETGMEQTIATLAQENRQFMEDRKKEFCDYIDDLQKNVAKPEGPILIPPGTILVAERLNELLLGRVSPWGNVIGFISAGAAPHAVQMAKSYGWSAIVDAPKIREKIATGEIIDGTHLYMDGGSGSIWLNPSTEWIAEFYREKEERGPENALTEIPSAFALTRCREKHIRFLANIERPEQLEEITKVWPTGTGSVGLFRTEVEVTRERFDGDKEGLSKDEQAQLRIYRPIVQAAHSSAPIFRLIDWGGEKSETEFSQGDSQLRPRGIQHSLLTEETRAVLRVQLRALLRASDDGPLKILLPMVVDATDIKEVRKELQQARLELAERGVYPPVENVSIGAMIETPSAVFVIPIILKHVDFVNIGSGDLTQYTLVAERGFALDKEKSWEKKRSAHHPSILIAMNQLIDSVHAHGKEVHGCGDMFSDPFYAPITVGLGLDSISVPPRGAYEMYQELSGLHYGDCQAFVGWAMLESDSDPKLVHDELHRFHDCIKKGLIWQPPESEPTQPEPLIIRT